MANPTESRDPLIGQVVGGRYFVIKLIGRGGTGSIYEVQNIRLGRSFALKTLKDDAATSAEALQRFRREAEIVAGIKHPNIVEIIDWDELPDGSPCIVMEYLRGEDLASRISSSAPLPWPMIAQIADRVFAALAVTHASGIVHRDLKPQNVFLALDDAGDEQIKLLDFGVSKFRDRASLVTTDARLVGTPAYMAPEQAQGQPTAVGTHTDLWAMAIMLHEMATGVLAFSGSNVPAVLYAICHAEPVPILERRPDASPAFVQLIADALVRPVDQRLADAAVMRARLRDALSEIPEVRFSGVLRAKPMTGAPPVGNRESARTEDALANTAPAGATPPPTLVDATAAAGATEPVTTARRRSRLVYALLGVIAVGATGVAYAVVRTQRQEPEAQPVAAVPVGEAATAPIATEPAAPIAANIDAEVKTHADDTMPKRPPTHREGNERKTRSAPQTGESTQRSYVQNATRAISARTAQLLACFDANGSGGEAIKATIVIGADGHAKRVSFAPERVDASPLGGCLRTEILRAQFPTADHEQTFSIPLRTTAR